MCITKINATSKWLAATEVGVMLSVESDLRVSGEYETGRSMLLSQSNGGACRP